jgi:hypothetical protein
MASDPTAEHRLERARDVIRELRGEHDPVAAWRAIGRLEVILGIWNEAEGNKS